MSLTATLLLTLLAAPPSGDASALGRRAFRAHCAPCHGSQGRGNGPAARWLDPPPRNFTLGNYKLRSTPIGELPTDADLLRTIDAGMPGSAMPAWRDRLPLATRRALVATVAAFSAEWAVEDPLPPIDVPAPPPSTPASIARGKVAYEAAKCGECHGPRGLGDGTSDKLVTADHRPISPPDLTSDRFRSGESPEAVYRILMTGLAGTPMPSYDASLPAADRWPLVHYVLSLREGHGALHYLFAPLEEQTR